MEFKTLEDAMNTFVSTVAIFLLAGCVISLIRGLLKPWTVLWWTEIIDRKTVVKFYLFGAISSIIIIEVATTENMPWWWDILAVVVFLMWIGYWWKLRGAKAQQYKKSISGAIKKSSQAMMKNEPDGFKEIKFGEPASKHKNKLVQVPSSKDDHGTPRFYYKNPKEKAQWNGITLREITYLFKRDGFSGALLTADRDHKEALFNQCQELWGAPQVTSGEQYLLVPDYAWRGTEAYVELKEDGESCTLEIRRR